ncbi:MAG: hypothetical protein AAGB29_03175 [Planctomycetota bacterium]
MSDASTSEAGWVVEGRLVSRQGDEAVLAIAGTDYRLHLVVEAGVEPDERGEMRGTIEAEAKRVDVVGSGGRFVEPVIGRPRRVQGRITGGDARRGAIVVNAGFGPMVCRLTDRRQTLADFSVGQLVGFDVLRGARLIAAEGD